jgi:hypothetical protein
MRKRGTGRITTHGYVQITINGKSRLAHHLAWEKHNGPIPKGMQVHHINEDRQDNRIENLKLVDPKVHGRIHSGCELRDGVWWKPCTRCGVLKPRTREQYYFVPGTDYTKIGICKPCHALDCKARVERVRKLRASQAQNIPD